MFGYVRANLADMTEQEQKRYRAVYCGLCRTLGRRHGLVSRMTLTYDMTFLCLLLSSLYEPEEERANLRCLPHPVKPHEYAVSEVTEYAADMTVALAYHQCMDDWNDDKRIDRKAMAMLLAKAYARVKALWPKQTEAIEQSLKELAQIEQRKEPVPDAAANSFGRLMAALFVMKEDYWCGAMRSFGMAMGRYIYLADAACDFDKDKKDGSYNPLVLIDKQPEDVRDALKQSLGAASNVFEALPLVSDANILRNILYSGIWLAYNEAMEKRKGEQKHGG